jgi:hypothetical protein
MLLVWGRLTTDDTSHITGTHNDVDAKEAEKTRDGAGGGLKT